MSDAVQGTDLFENLNTDPVIRPPDKNDSFRRIWVNFLSEADVQQYAILINRSITAKTKELWFPPKDESLKTLFDWNESGSYEPLKKKKVKEDVSLETNLWEAELDPGFYAMHWQNMPEFHQPDASAVRKILHVFQTTDDVSLFAKVIKQNITKQTSSVWYPYREKNNVKDLYWIAV